MNYDATRKTYFFRFQVVARLQPCYIKKMFLLYNRFCSSRQGIRLTGLLLAVVLFVCSVLQNANFCFCSDEFGAQKESHHGGDGMAGLADDVSDHACEHLEVGELLPAKLSVASAVRVHGTCAPIMIDQANSRWRSEGTKAKQFFCGRPVGARQYQLIFIARSTQILC